MLVAHVQIPRCPLSLWLRTCLSYLILTVLGCPTSLMGRRMSPEGTLPETAVKCSFTGSIGPSAPNGLLTQHLCFLLLLILFRG